ncbi:MFS transporter [Nostoc sp. CENA67]|uniref:MFS transporter n=1 Tax=Amazonocrinis nigriterrae CENA67 TaxID=2794033 RepID=A0A8J7I0H0_9NOST|nr:MFS transporter [Amazonocrinis nigriterrae]MBH8567020.1 MFS transporter [Amazonocrinis nigriterrae CENA67]
MAKRIITDKLQVFIITWLGQLISLIGSGLTGFALGLWVYQQTGSVTQFALVSLFTTSPGIILSPITGALVDRWERRATMLLCNTVAGLTTLVLVLLLFMNQLQVWQIYTGMSVISVCTAFQFPAYTATITLLVPKKHLGRASGMTNIGEASARLFAPALAGVMVLTIGVLGVLLIDFASYLFAVVTLLIVQFPKPKKTTASNQGKSSLLKEAVYGWTYIIKHPGLLGLLLFFAGSNFGLGIASVLITPMLLAFTSPAILGNVMSIAGSGMLVGSIIMSVWGGPKPRVYGVFGFGLLQAVCLLLVGLHPSIPLITAAAFGVFFCVPFMDGCNQTIWQTKVPPDVQGRVFAVRLMIAWSSFPLAYLLAGPLADYVFEPLLASGGLLASSVGTIIGVGTGRGIGLLFIVLGILNFWVAIFSYLYQPLRMIEKENIAAIYQLQE